MKTVLAATAALALSASSAFAMCQGHDVNASADESLTVASVDTTTAEPATDQVTTGAVEEEKAD